MSDTQNLIEQLDQKIEQLIGKVRELGAAVDEKNGEIASLKGNLKEKDEAVAKLLEENSALKSQDQETSKKESPEMKAKISELVKEIDECLSLLKV